MPNDKLCRMREPFTDFFGRICQRSLGIVSCLLQTPCWEREDMTTTAFFSAIRPSIIRRLRQGPLGPYIDEYASRLAQQGISRITARRTLSLIANLSRWLGRKRLGVDQLDEESLARYRCSRT